MAPKGPAAAPPGRQARNIPGKDSDFPMKTYGVVLIGCGHIGCEHLADIYFRPGIRIVAVVDTDLAKAEQARRRYAAAYCGADYRPFLEREDVEIVIIATNVDSHLAILRDCVRAGKHVLCEKPIAGSREEGRAFYECARNAPVQVSVAHILRYNETYRRARELIASGAIGQLKVVRMVQNHHSKDWPRYRRLLEDCSPVLDCGVHYFDVLQWFSGSPITRVSGIGAAVDPDLPAGVLNYGMVQLHTQSGVVGYYEAGWGRGFCSSNVKEFVGTQGHLTLTLRDFRTSHREEGDLIELFRQETGEYRAINVEGEYKPMWRQLSALIRRIEGKTSEMPPLADLYSAFLVGLAADEAIRTGEIRAPELPPAEEKRAVS